MTSPTPAPRWAAGDKAMVEIAETSDSGRTVRLRDHGLPENRPPLISVRTLLPLPSATAEDEAVLVEAALQWLGREGEIIAGPATPEWSRLACATAAIRSRRARAQGAETTSKDAAPAIEAAREAVVQAAMKQLDEHDRAHGGWTTSWSAMADATEDAARTLRALLTPPPPPDPVAELVKIAGSVIDQLDKWETMDATLFATVTRLRSALAAMEART